MKTKSKTELDRLQDLDFWKNEPKHAAITRLLEKHIRQMRHGDKLPAIRDLMRRFRTGQNTIEHALSKLEARRLITRRWGSGIYVNRQGIKKVIRRMIGVVVSDVTDPFCALLFKGIGRKLMAQHHHAILCNGYRQFQAELDTIHSLHGKIDGAIINPTSINALNPEYVRYFSELVKSGEFPFLLAAVTIPGVNAPYVGFDDFTAFFEMAGVLSSSRTHFHRIVYLGALESVIGAERINGFRAGVKENNIPEASLETINVPVPVSEIVINAENFQGGQPTILVSASPLILPRLLAFCYARNLRIPEDVVLAGVVEENFYDHIHVPILAWVKPAVKLGELAVRRIQELIAGKSVRQITKVPLERSVPEALQNLF